jgi:electron transfer flavoprotein alpha subunit
VGTTPLSKELAEKIGARPEASRPLIGPRQLPSPAQVGSPGKKAAPSVHLAFDISGVTQRRSGTRRSDPIVAAGHSAGADSVDIARELDELS